MRTTGQILSTSQAILFIASLFYTALAWNAARADEIDSMPAGAQSDEFAAGENEMPFANTRECFDEDESVCEAEGYDSEEFVESDDVNLTEIQETRTLRSFPKVSKFLQNSVVRISVESYPFPETTAQ